MQDFFKHLPAVLYEYVVRPDGSRNFNFISDAGESVLGLSSQTATCENLSFESFVHKDDIQSFLDTLAASERGGKDWNWQGRIWVRGKVKWMEFSSNQESKSDGSIIRRGIVQDITARKDRADESEVKYVESIELLPIGIIIHKQGKLIYVDAQAYAILGVDEE